MDQNLASLLNNFSSAPTGECYVDIVTRLQVCGAESILATLDTSTRDQLLKSGTEVFDKLSDFYSWLWADLRPLGYKKPIDLIRLGRLKEVMELLNQIEHSTYS